MASSKKMSFLVGFLLLAIGLGWGLNKSDWFQGPAAVQTEVATVLQPGKSLGKFHLDSTLGQPFTEQSLFGHWTVLFFGYAQCPKICPQALTLISEVWRSYPENKPHPNARFVFASLNPEVDTVENLQTFLQQFHPDFIGVTGLREEIVRLSTASGVYSWTDPAQDGSAGRPKIIDHSATILLISPEGRLKALFSPPHQPLAIAKDLRLLMQG